MPSNLEALFGRSPRSTLCAIGAGLSAVLIFLGLWFKNQEVLTVGIGMIPLILAALGLVTRDESQHVDDRQNEGRLPQDVVDMLAHKVQERIEQPRVSTRLVHPRDPTPDPARLPPGVTRAPGPPR